MDIKENMETIKIRFTKIQSDHTALRTDVVEGVIHKKPEIFECLEIYAKPLDPTMAERYIKTSPIMEFETFDDIPDTIIFKTLNSKYMLEYL